PHRVVGQGVGEVVGHGPVLGVGVGGDQGVVAGQGERVVEAAAAADHAVEPVEPALQGPVVLRAVGLDVARDVPLADHVGAVPGGPQNLGDGGGVAVQVAAVAGEPGPPVFRHVADARLVRVEAGEQAGAGRAAPGGVVELGESEAAGGQRVEVRGAD